MTSLLDSSATAGSIDMGVADIAKVQPITVHHEKGDQVVPRERRSNGGGHLSCARRQRAKATNSTKEQVSRIC
jgi:hypothetical protein